MKLRTARVQRPARDHLERTFAWCWKALGGVGDWQREYRFAPPRMWRFDFALPAHRVAVEIDGAVWTQGRHTRGAGYERDCEKLNTAAALGWRVFRLTGGMLRREPERWVRMIRDALDGEV